MSSSSTLTSAPGRVASRIWSSTRHISDLALAGLILIENLFRNSPRSRDWNIKYLCLGVGALFAYDFFLYADAVLFRRLSPDLFLARGATNMSVLPFLVVYAARNRKAGPTIVVSRRVVSAFSDSVLRRDFIDDDGDRRLLRPALWRGVEKLSLRPAYSSLAPSCCWSFRWSPALPRLSARPDREEFLRVRIRTTREWLLHREAIPRKPIRARMRA